MFILYHKFDKFGIFCKMFRFSRFYDIIINEYDYTFNFFDFPDFSFCFLLWGGDGLNER